MDDDFAFPHTVEAYPLTQGTFEEARYAGNPVLGDPATVRGDLQERTPGKFLQTFGFTFDNPAVLYVEVSDAPRFEPSTVVRLGDRVYAVVGDARIDEAGDEMDGAVVPLQRLDFPRFPATATSSVFRGIFTSTF